jgi:hypothetical protein
LFLVQRDRLEDKPVFECLLKLLSARHPQLMALLPQLLLLFARTVPDSSKVNPEIRRAVVCRVVLLYLVVQASLAAFMFLLDLLASCPLLCRCIRPFRPLLWSA